jgi:hypothetical protein
MADLIQFAGGKRRTCHHHHLHLRLSINVHESPCHRDLPKGTNSTSLRRPEGL